jgi:ribonuclease P protein component
MPRAVPHPHAFRKSSHLRHPREFDRVFQLRCSAREGPLLVFAAPGLLETRRMGLSVSRRNIGGAVVRNRVKRLLREAFRLTAAGWPEGFDWVLVPQKGFEPKLERLLRDLPALARRTAERARRRQREAGPGGILPAYVRPKFGRGQGSAQPPATSGPAASGPATPGPATPGPATPGPAGASAEEARPDTPS